MAALLSYETRIRSTLRELDPAPSLRDFASVARIKGIAISIGPLSQALSGRGKALSNDLGRRLLELAQLMKTTEQYFVDIPICWAEHDRAALLLTLVLMRVIAAEQRDDILLDAAENALAAELTK